MRYSSKDKKRKNTQEKVRNVGFGIQSSDKPLFMFTLDAKAGQGAHP